VSAPVLAVVGGRAAGSAPERSRHVRCGLCGQTFREDRGQPACQGCPLVRTCRYIRCPHCGFENPVMPGWLDSGPTLPGRASAGDRPDLFDRLLQALGRLRRVTPPLRSYLGRLAVLGRGERPGQRGGAPTPGSGARIERRSRRRRDPVRLKLLGRETQAVPAGGMEGSPLLLTDLAPGQEGTVVSLDDPASLEGRALAGLGLLPGAAVRAVQRYPAWIVRVDYAEVALDDGLASRVRIERSGA